MPYAFPLLALACAAAMPSIAGAQACASTPAEARSWLAALAWQETSMADGKPLRMRIDEREGAMHVQFVKAGEGLWAEGRARLCRVGDVVQVRLSPSDLTFGPAAGWFLRHVLGGGATFRITPLDRGRLHVATPGWSGEFAPQAD